MANASGAIAYALAQLGKPYVWGATGPNSYDCSGLMYAAYKSIGMEIPRSTYDMLGSRLTKVPKEQLAPGDLIFPESGHVQMYLGAGKIVEAPRPGLNVRISDVGTVWQARRVTDPGTLTTAQQAAIKTGSIHIPGTPWDVPFLLPWDTPGVSGWIPSPSELESAVVQGMTSGLVNAFKGLFTPFLKLIVWSGMTTIGALILGWGIYIMYRETIRKTLGELNIGQN